MDDRGHFYKPIQQGPRGDRERLFYEAVAAELAAEAAAAARQADGVAEPPPLPRSLPKLIPTRLPSFRERAGEDLRGAVQIAQRDEYGLLATPTLRELRVGSPDWLGRSPDSEGAELTAEHLMDGFRRGRPLELSAAAGNGASAADAHAALLRPPSRSSSLGPAGSGVDNTDSSAAEAGEHHEPRAPPASLTDPRHAEAAAMLGQPIFDVELSQPLPPPQRHRHHQHHQQQERSPRGPSPLAAPPLPAGSPGPSEPRNYSHQPAPREAQRSGAEAAAPAAASGPGAGSGVGAAGEQAAPQGAAASPPLSPTDTAPGSGTGMGSRSASGVLRSFSAPLDPELPFQHGDDLRFARTAVAAGAGSPGQPWDAAAAAGSSPPPADAGAERRSPFDGPALGREFSGERLPGPAAFACSPRANPRLWLSVSESESEDEGAAGSEQLQRRPGLHLLPFSVRNALLLKAIPKFCEWGRAGGL